MKIETIKNTTTISANGIQISIPSAELFRHFNQAFLSDCLNTALERTGMSHEQAAATTKDEAFLERWLEAVANDETIAACLSDLASKCVAAQNLPAKTPLFKAGDRVIYNYINTYHSVTNPSLIARNGNTATILQDPVEKSTYGYLRGIQFADGYAPYVYESELTIAKPAEEPHDFVKNLAQYQGGALNGPQIRELCSYFTVMADTAILLSPDFRVFFRNGVLPKLVSEEMCLCVEAKTIDCISGLAAKPGPLWDHACGAKDLLIDLHNRSLLCTRYVGEDGPFLESPLNVADTALANFIHQGKSHSICLFTNNPVLINQILTEENAPKCICVGFNKDNEFFIHPASQKRLAALCWPQKDGAGV